MIDYIIPFEGLGITHVHRVIKNDNGVKKFIALDPRSQDYADYQAWLGLGNTPKRQVDDAAFKASIKPALRKHKRQFGENLIDKISLINETKSLSPAAVDAFMTNPLIVSLREHLWAGNISTFISLLSSADVSAFFTAEEKAAVLAECNAFLTSISDLE